MRRRARHAAPAQGSVLTDEILAANLAADLATAGTVKRRYEPAEDTAAEGPGILESGARGAAQGLSLGFADEITGALESAFTDKTYTAARDESRGKYKAAQDANPIAYGAGEVGGSLASVLMPGMGLAKGASVAKSALQAGATGAASGLGASDADLTEGEIGGAALDTAVGGGLGAGLAGVFGLGLRGFASGAPRRHAANEAKELTAGATPTQARRALGGDPAEFIEVLERDPATYAALKKGPEKGLAAAQAKLGDLSDRTRPRWDRLDGATGGVRIGDLKAYFARATDDAVDAADDNLETALDNTLASFVRAKTRKLANDKVDDFMVPHREVRSWVTDLLKKSNRTIGSLNEMEASNLKGKIHDVGHGFLREHMENVAGRFPEVAGDVAEIRALNKEISAYARVSQLLEHVDEREFWKKDGLGRTLREAGIPGLAALMGGGANIPGAIAAGVGAKALVTAGSAINKSATKYMAQLAKAARDGSVTAELKQEAIANGVPLATVKGILSAHRQSLQAMGGDES